MVAVTFHATKEWQPFPEDAIAPPGLQFQMNMATGQREARIMPERPKSYARDNVDLGREMGAVARELYGEPNKKLSSKTELRFGTHGSLSIDLLKGRWYDHEVQLGGNVLELIQYANGPEFDAVAWCRERGYLPVADAPKARKVRQAKPAADSGNGHDNGTGHDHGHDVASYVYRDQEGTPIYRAVREEPKRFRQERYDPEHDSYIRRRGCMEGVHLVPYRLDELLAELNALVLIPEGEKDVDRLWSLGFVATTNVAGAGKWGDELSSWLAGRDVVVLPDNDPLDDNGKGGAGRKHAAQVIRSLLPHAARVRLLELPDLPPKGDVSDWLDAGHTAEDLQHEIETHVIVPDEGVIQRLEAGRDCDVLPFRYLDVMAILGPLPEERFVVDRWMPHRHLTSLYGAGGVGKSFLAMMAAVCVIGGKAWLGYPCEQGNVLAIMCEDDEGELIRRLYRIAGGCGVDAGTLANRLFITPRLGMMNQMIQFHAGMPATTEFYRHIRAEAKRTDAKLVIVDNAAQTYPGNENDRGQSTAYLNSLVGIAQEIDGSVLLLGHPPKSGAHQFSGSTAWENVPRSRLWFEPKEIGDGEYTLTLGKTNDKRGTFAVGLKKSSDQWGLVENVGEVAIDEKAKAIGRPSKAGKTISLLEDLYHSQQQEISITELTREAMKLGIVNHALETDKAWYNREATIRQHLAKHPDRVEFRSKDTVAIKP